MASFAVSSVLFVRDEAGNHAETISMDENSALDYTLLANLVVETLKRCPKSAMDCVVTRCRWKTMRYRHADQSCEELFFP